MHTGGIPARHATLVPQRSRTAEITGAFRVAAVALVATTLGVVALAVRGDGSAINTVLFMECGMPHTAAATLERATALGVLAAAVIGLLLRWWPLLLPSAALILVEAIARQHVLGEGFAEWATLTYAARYAMPVAAACLLVALKTSHQPADSVRESSVLPSIAAWIIRISVAAVFLSHGGEALNRHPGFIDLIISSAANLTGLRVSESTARALLEGVGLMDCGFAAAMLLYAWRPVLAAAAVWATIATFSRMTANGWGAYPDVLIRSSYFLGPFALLLLTTRHIAQRNERPAPCLGSHDDPPDTALASS